MQSTDSIRKAVFDRIISVTDNAVQMITDDLPLIGDSSVLDSMKLVELCLALEDLAAELDFEFDWTSEATMSRSRSMFRNAGSLTDEFIRQLEAKK